MLYPLLQVAAIIFAGLLAYRYYKPVLAALRRFDAQNRERIEGELKDRRDQLAHFRHTLRRAEEQVDEIGEITLSDVKTGIATTRYTFEGERFATRRDAERAREEKVRELARKFYMELPAALAARREDGRLN
jgi:hypothetical protein